LVGYWDTVAFDEFAGKKKRANKALVDILKNYMANKTFSRGIETLGAEASMVFVGNTRHNLQYMLMHSDLFDELPEQYYDSAFLDRIHFYIPGWEVEIIRGEMFSEGYGFVVDYLAEILRTLRNYDYAHHYREHFELLSDISTRDRDGINKTFSGLMKIIYPHGEATEDAIERILEFSIEGRKRVKDQVMRIDTTYADVRFGYQSQEGSLNHVKTLEEKEHPQHYYQKAEFAISADQETMHEFVQPVNKKDTPRLRDLDKRIGQIELNLRKSIQEVLGEDTSKIPSHILIKVEKRIRSALRKNPSLDKDYYQTPAGKLEFVDLRELQDMIVTKTLWPDFEPIFINKVTLNGKFNQLAELRNGIRHSRTVDEITKKEGEAAILWFEKILDR